MKRSSSCAMVLIAMLAVQTQGYCTWNTQQTPGTSSNSSVSTALVVGAVVVVGVVVAVKLGKRHSVAFYPVLSGGAPGVSVSSFPSAPSFMPVAVVPDPSATPAFSAQTQGLHQVLDLADSGDTFMPRFLAGPEKWRISTPSFAPLAAVSGPAVPGSETVSWKPRILNFGEPWGGKGDSVLGSKSPLIP